MYLSTVVSITVEIMYEIGWKLQLDCGEYTPYNFTQEIRIYKSFEKGGITGMLWLGLTKKVCHANLQVIANMCSKLPIDDMETQGGV